MENYNVLVLMEKDKESGFLTNTIDSYMIETDINLIAGVYLVEEAKETFVYLTLTTKDVEDWEYYGIYELYNDELYVEGVLEVIEDAEQFNPCWILKILYKDDRFYMENLINSVLKQHIAELQRINSILSINKEQYLKEYSEIERGE